MTEQRKQSGLRLVHGNRRQARAGDWPRLRIPAEAGPRPLPGQLQPAAPKEALPVWLAVLVAAHCQATGNGDEHRIRWTCEAGCATYTNAGGDAERIEPLGVQLPAGHTLSVTWSPGETAYTTEVYPLANRCA
jgi:hypothetical protein